MNQPRPAVLADVPELLRLRLVMIRSLGREPGPEDADWRASATTWLRRRLARPDEWAFRVIGPEAGPLQACGAAWLTEHLPGPRAPHGVRGYVGLMCTEPEARRQGHARRILDDLVAWLGRQQVTRIELHASPEGQSLYRAAGFVADTSLPMYLSLEH